MNRFAIAAVATLGAITISACSDSTDDVVQPPAPGAAPAPVTEQAADTATASDPAPHNASAHIRFFDMGDSSSRRTCRIRSGAVLRYRLARRHR